MLRSAATDLITGGRFFVALSSFLRHPIDPAHARAVLRRRLETRQEDFLDLIRRTVFEALASPYRTLMASAGCELGDLERLVKQEGLEGALEILARRGVYLTVDEFKGRRPVVRGSVTFDIAPGQLQNPFATTHVRSQTGGSRGHSTPVALDLAFIREMAVNYCLVADARGERDWVHAVWLVPSGDAIVKMLRHARFGAIPVRWFSQFALHSPEVHPRYRLGARVLRWAGRLARVPLPWPEHVSIEDPTPIVRWIAAVLGTGRTPHLITIASSAVRICQAAAAGGVNLRGARFTLAGEPTTAARLSVVQAVGADAHPIYATTEAGVIGLGCLARETSDDVHMFHDRVAVIAPRVDSPSHALPRDALFISTLRVVGTPVILLNVSLGDQAVMTERRCGCPLEALGWSTHLHTIRSYEKLTAAGMAFLDSDLVRILEDVLPKKFGGGPGDYQLVEDEMEDGRPRLRLLVHPSVGRLDGETVAATFLSAAAVGTGGQPLMALAWRDAKLLTVERRPPITTSAGKILHLHVEPTRMR